MDAMEVCSTHLIFPRSRCPRAACWNLLFLLGSEQLEPMCLALMFVFNLAFFDTVLSAFFFLYRNHSTRSLNYSKKAGVYLYSAANVPRFSFAPNNVEDASKPGQQFS